MFAGCVSEHVPAASEHVPAVSQKCFCRWGVTRLLDDFRKLRPELGQLRLPLTRSGLRNCELSVCLSSVTIPNSFRFERRLLDQAVAQSSLSLANDPCPEGCRPHKAFRVFKQRFTPVQGMGITNPGSDAEAPPVWASDTEEVWASDSSTNEGSFVETGGEFCAQFSHFENRSFDHRSLAEVLWAPTVVWMSSVGRISSVEGPAVRHTIRLMLRRIFARSDAVSRHAL